MPFKSPWFWWDSEASVCPFRVNCFGSGPTTWDSSNVPADDEPDRRTFVPVPHEADINMADWISTAARSLAHNGFCALRCPGGSLVPLDVCEGCRVAADARLDWVLTAARARGLNPRRDKLLFRDVCCRQPDDVAPLSVTHLAPVLPPRGCRSHIFVGSKFASRLTVPGRTVGFERRPTVPGLRRGLERQWESAAFCASRCCPSCRSRDSNSTVEVVWNGLNKVSNGRCKGISVN